MQNSAVRKIIKIRFELHTVLVQGEEISVDLVPPWTEVGMSFNASPTEEYKGEGAVNVR
jgi:hypothetical protein